MSPLADLRAAAARHPERPWLFHREGIDWRWRSYRQVADHLAFAQDALRARAEPGFAYSARLHPDALLSGLALLAAGRRARPWTLGEAPTGLPYVVADAPKYREPVPKGVDPVVLPASPSLLRPAPGPPPPLGDLEGGILVAAGVERSFADFARAVDAWSPAIRWQGPNGRAIFHLGTTLGAALDHAVLALTLRGHAALALEPYPEAVVESILWCRPSHLALTPAEVDEVASAFGPADRKRSRLVQLLVSSGASDAQRDAWRRHFGAEIATLELP